MDMTWFNTVSADLSSAVTVMSTSLLILVLFADKKLSSMSVGLIVFCLGEATSAVFTPHLKTWSGVTADYGYAAWYLGWIVQNLVLLGLLLKLHRCLKIHLSKLALITAWYYTAAIIAQAIDFIDRLIFKSDLFAPFYAYGQLAMNASILPLLLFTFCFELRQQRQISRAQEA